jgi:transcriptional regulator GlxA family with amidase domain
VDANLITSQGAGTATEFSLALVEHLVDKKTADEIAASICWKH